MSSSDPFRPLVQLSSQRWLVPLLADLAAFEGARFAELLHRLALPRDSLVRTLGTAVELGWVARNSGHGHPLRPEYLITEAGRHEALRARQIAAAQAQLGLPPGSLTRWGLPLAAAIAQGHDRFNALSRLLVPASPRALSQGLLALDRRHLIQRMVIDGRPPASHYAVTESGAILAVACRAGC
jgi:DNA-binding HxlR family transcriptional regulator